ncbi:MAG TPA: SRPBCC family protein [Planktothrix sp.]
MLNKKNLLVAACGLLVVTPFAPPAESRKAVQSDNATQSAADPTVESAAKHGVKGITEIRINAPTEVVWGVLTDFQKYPQVFRRIESCRVTKRVGDMVFTETHLKKQLFVQEPLQHEVNDLGKAPHQLSWRELDGNFKAMDGVWQLHPLADGRCMATYTLAVDPGMLVPGPIAGLVLHGMQKEITAELKKAAETTYLQVKTSQLPDGQSKG